MSYLSDHTELFNFISAIVFALFGFIIYRFLSESKALKKNLKINTGETLDVLLRRLSGVLCFGCLPFFFILFSDIKNMANFGLNPPTSESFFWTILLSVIILPFNYYHSSNPDNLQIYPQIRKNKWTFTLLIASAISWVVYLFSYEFLFRGFLFFASIPILGLWPSIFLNTLIYSLFHLPKGRKETLGAIPFGILLCYLTYRTNSFWLAVFTHVIMALSSEWFSLRAHPQMFVKIVRK